VRLLLDTHVVLWQLAGVRALGTRAEHAIREAHELLVSAVSFAEIGVKAALGKLEVPPDLAERVRDAGVRALPLRPEHGLAVASLPLHHRDPFDRLLVAQARHEELALLSADARLGAYDVALVDALG
jgi:PIN domain nuclease of toxin-antitoxin system